MVVCFYNAAPLHYLQTHVGDQSTIERSLAFVRDLGHALREEVGVRCYSTCDLPLADPGWRVQAGSALDEQGLIAFLADAVDGPDDELLYAPFDAPFLNVELATRLVERHRTYRAEYTFADGYPRGLAVEVVSGRVVSDLATLAKPGDAVTRAGLFAIVQRDINRLDVETELSRVDQRLLRLDLCVGTRADLMVCERLATDAPDAIDEWAAHAERLRPSHRSLPRFVSIQVLDQEQQAVEYSAWKLVRADVQAPGGVMSSEDFGELVDQIDALSPEAVVHLSRSGEIALHPQAVDFVERVLAAPALKVLVETCGVGWDAEARERLFSIASDRLILIVAIDSDDRAIYETVRGEGYDEAHEFARTGIERLGSRCHVQAVRSQLTEPGLDAFYRGWKEVTPNVIIEKYDHYSRRLPDLKIGDISPLHRFPCWHLQRDLYVALDGSVALCREDIDGSTRLGNALSGGLRAAWEAGTALYAEHVAGRYPGICGACDEYYTFNF